MRQNLNLVTDPRFAWRTRRFSGYDIPPQEVAELYKLFTQTGGPSWINHTNWFANKTCANWYGLTVAGGRVTKIELPNNNLAGMTNFSPKPFSALTILYAQKDSSNKTLSMRFGLADLPATMQQMALYATQSLITGSLADLPSTMQGLYLGLTQSLITGGASAMAAKGTVDIQIQSTATDQAGIDDICNRIYTDRALFTKTAPKLNIGGTNPDPTGVYQTSANPATPLEKVYALVNDQNAEGFKKWAITY